MSSIRVSPKHGLNPTVPICFWCGKEKNEVALLGKLPKDVEAPMHCIIDHEPCDECLAGWKKGTVIIEADSNPVHEGQKVWHGGYPTGRYIVVNPAALTSSLQGNKVLFMMPVDFEQMLEKGKKVEVG